MPTYKVVTEIKLMVEAEDAFAAAQAVAIRLRGLNTSTRTQDLNMTVQPVIPELVPGEDADEPDGEHKSPHFDGSGLCNCDCDECGRMDCKCPYGCAGTSGIHRHRHA